MRIKIYVEGGAKGKQARAKVREGFNAFFSKCGFEGTLPSVVPCGSRNDAFDGFHTEKSQTSGTNVCLLVDSEDPMENIEETWVHLKHRDNWDRPDGAVNDDVLMMTTCMETWFVADRETLARVFGKDFSASSLPADTEQENRDRKVLLTGLKKATAKCSGPYEKGDKSFDVLSEIQPDTVIPKLPSLKRIVRILEERL